MISDYLLKKIEGINRIWNEKKIRKVLKEGMEFKIERKEGLWRLPELGYMKE